jgi:uncharacterized protein (TIGR03437 family)
MPCLARRKEVTRKRLFALFLFLVVGLTGLLIPTASAQTFDNSGNSQLNGTYYFREVYYVASGGLGNLSRAVLVFNTITFDGAGKYTAAAQVLDSSSASATAVSGTLTGTYSISASGFGFITNPYDNTSLIYGNYANGVFMGSTTEPGYNHLFIAVQVPGVQATNATLSGNYTLAHFDVTNGQVTNMRDAWVQFNANGAGGYSNGTATGFVEPGTGVVTSAPAAANQSIGNNTYAFSNGAANINFGTGGTLIAGNKILYTTPDGNFVFGGSTTGWDFFVGVRNSTSQPLLDGLYYQAGLYEDLTPGYGNFSNYWGSFFAFSGSTIYSHQRLNPYDQPAAYHNTFRDTFTMGGDGTYDSPDGLSRYATSQGGTFRIGFGKNAFMGISAAMVAPKFSGNGVYIDPTGIQNAGSYTTFTAGIAKGELIIIKGNNLGPANIAVAGLPFPTSLGGVTVLINGIKAPIYYASKNQLAVVVPYGVSDTPFGVASIQVINALASDPVSNTVTVFLNKSAPGIYTLTQNGQGSAAVLHGDYTVVSKTSPAKPGEAVLLFLTGLGAVTPTLTEGTIAADYPATPTAVSTPGVYINGTQAQVFYSGLAPQLVALYQINFVIPSTITTGDATVTISGPDYVSTQATIPVQQ